MALTPPIDFNFPPYHPYYPSSPPPPPHSFPPPPPYGHPPPPPPPPPSHPYAPPPPHKHAPPPPHHPYIPPPPHVRPPPHPFPPPPSPDNHPTVIIIVFVSFGGILFLSLLAFALCCLVKRKKKTRETEIIHFDEHKHVTEAIVPGPHGEQIVVISVEDDVHIDEEIVKTEELGHGLHANAESSTNEGNASSIDSVTKEGGTSSNVNAGTTTSSDHDHNHHQQLENKP